MSRRAALNVLVGTIAVAYGLAAVLVARRHGQITTYAGSSDWTAGLELIAGWALVAAGLATSRLRPQSVSGPLVVAAAFAWFASDWVGWEGGPPLVRSVGMLVTAAWLPLLVHACIAFQGRGLPSLGYRVLVALLYVETAVVTIASVLFRDPFDDPNCWNNCTENSFLVRPDEPLVRAFEWFDPRFHIAFAAAFVALGAWRLGSATDAGRRRLAPTLVASTALVVVAAAQAIVLLGTPLQDPRDATFAALFIAQCIAASVAAAALGSELARSRRAVKAVERVAVELSVAPEPGTLEAALARVSRDPSLRIAFPLRDAEQYVDSQGTSIPTPPSAPHRAVTPILRDGEPVALVEHDPLALDDLVRDRIGAAARLGIENERLRAMALAQLVELRESRARIVETSDAARQRLERDLHDGAQQRLVALSFALRLAAAELNSASHPELARPLADADSALAEALAAVRAVANGLFPATLMNSGLADAIDELAEHTTIRLDVESVPASRFPQPVETAAYGVIREAVENAALRARASMVSISAAQRSDMIIVDVADDGVGGADVERDLGLLEMSDRVGALGGRVSIQSPAGGGTRIRAEIPCG